MIFNQVDSSGANQGQGHSSMYARLDIVKAEMLKALGIQAGHASLGTFSSGSSIEDKQVTFPRAFSKKPYVAVSYFGTNDAGSSYPVGPSNHCYAVVHSITTTGFKVNAMRENYSSSGINYLEIDWIAIEI